MLEALLLLALRGPVRGMWLWQWIRCYHLLAMVELTALGGSDCFHA